MAPEMTPAKHEPAAHAQRDTGKPRPASDPLQDSADALLRGALEACRQHERVAGLLGRGCAEDELRAAASVCELADRHLDARTKGYEAVAANGKGKTPDDFWRAANTLWHSSREYARRHRSCDALTTKLGTHSSGKLGGHSSGKLGELTLDYELEASALLALSQAIAAYRKLRPDAG
jgi:hypothetical protein